MAPVVPVHEQYYPTKVLSHRLEEYVLDDGRSPTQVRAFAKRVTGQQTLDAVLAAQAALGLTNIDPRYFVGTCFHEAGCSNEWDTEVATPSSPSGFQSVGAYQIGDEEARRFKFTLADMLDFDKATSCMIQLAEAHRAQLRKYVGLVTADPDYTDTDGIVWKGGTMRAYLAIAHNHGLGYVRLTIAKYGMDWGSYQSRNPQDNIVSHTYGHDCVTGGPLYPNPTVTLVKPGDRILRMAVPHMHGYDVAELQRHLKINPDGDFGAVTETTLKMFQRNHGLLDDGVCGTKTWTAVLATS